ncbi:hypothetical protein ACRRTK_019293 [Alexandromys fortis]
MVGKYESYNVDKKALVSGLMDCPGGAAQELPSRTSITAIEKLTVLAVRRESAAASGGFPTLPCTRCHKVVTVGHIKTKDDELAYNIHLVVNVLLSCLKKKKWQHKLALVIKNTIG